MVRRSQQGQALIELLIGSFILISLFLMQLQIEMTGLNQMNKYQFNLKKENKYELPKHLKKKFYLHKN